jgi:hypothetical protein
MMAQWARQRGIPVVFILLHDNPNETYALRAGTRYLAEKNYELAIKFLHFARDRPRSWFAGLASLYLAQAYAAIGLTSEAREALSLENVQASVHGGYPVVLDSEYNKIMMEVALQFGAQVLDAASELDKAPGVYFDFCHFDRQGHEIVGRLVADAIKAARMKSTANN